MIKRATTRALSELSCRARTALATSSSSSSFRSGIDEPFRVDQCLTTVRRTQPAYRGRKRSTIHRRHRNVDDRPHPVVLVRLSVDVRVTLRFRKPTADRDAFQRYVCHTSKRMSCQTPGIRRGSEASGGQGDAQPAAGDLRPI